MISGKTVALMDQWYLDYGEESWREQALEYVEGKDGKGVSTPTPTEQDAFIGVLNWLNQWACARTYGLGSKLPWDPHFRGIALRLHRLYEPTIPLLTTCTRISWAGEGPWLSRLGLCHDLDFLPDAKPKASLANAPILSSWLMKSGTTSSAAPT